MRKFLDLLLYGSLTNSIGEIAYILMGIWFLIMGQYLICIMLIGVWILATKLQNDFKKWAFDDNKEKGGE